MAERQESRKPGVIGERQESRKPGEIKVEILAPNIKPPYWAGIEYILFSPFEIFMHPGYVASIDMKIRISTPATHYMILYLSNRMLRRGMIMEPLVVHPNSHHSLVVTVKNTTFHLQQIRRSDVLLTCFVHTVPDVKIFVETHLQSKGQSINSRHQHRKNQKYDLHFLTIKALISQKTETKS